MDFMRKSRKKTPPIRDGESSQDQGHPADFLNIPLPQTDTQSKARSESPTTQSDIPSTIVHKRSNGELGPSSNFAASIFNSAPLNRVSPPPASSSTSRNFFGTKRDKDGGRSPRSSKSPSTSSLGQEARGNSGTGWHQTAEPIPEPDASVSTAAEPDPALAGRSILLPPSGQLRDQSLSAVRHTSLPFNEALLPSFPISQGGDTSTSSQSVPALQSAVDLESRQRDGFVQPSSTRSSVLHPQMHPEPQYEAHLTSHGHEEQMIPVDNSIGSDSAFGDGADMESATTSLRSAISDYIYENGRRYHAYRAGEYWGPNDEQMADQLDIGHHIHTMVLDGRLHLAPIGDSPHRVLDVGTGTGIWAIDFADQYPDCQVIGTDLSPTQPNHVPPNLQFEVDDACSEWVYTKESFDFIHVRGMYGSVSDWPKFYSECMKHLKPGGYLEQVDTSVIPKSDDGSVRPDSVMAKWGQVSLEAGDAFGKSLRCVDENRQNFIDAGFQDVVEYRFKLPIGGWSKDKRLKEIGVYTRLYWEEGVEGWCIFLLTRYLGWKYEEVMVYVAQMRKMLRDRGVHAYHDGSVVYGRKPFKPIF